MTEAEIPKYIRLDATIKTNQFGDVERIFYRKLVESYTMYRRILNNIEEFNLPIEVSFSSKTNNDFCADFIDRQVQETDNRKLITEEQHSFEIEKSVKMLSGILSVETILNR